MCQRDSVALAGERWSASGGFYFLFCRFSLVSSSFDRRQRRSSVDEQKNDDASERSSVCWCWRALFLHAFIPPFSGAAAWRWSSESILNRRNELDFHGEQTENGKRRGWEKSKRARPHPRWPERQRQRRKKKEQTRTSKANHPSLSSRERALSASSRGSSRKHAAAAGRREAERRRPFLSRTKKQGAFLSPRTLDRHARTHPGRRK